MPSRRELIRMTPDEIDEFLHGRRTMNIATFGPDGNIHLVAMWYGFLENGNPAFETFAKSQKVLNVKRNPRITALIEAGDNYEELRGIEIVGNAIVHDDVDTMTFLARDVGRRYFGADDEATLDAVVQMLTRKRVAIEIVPEKIVSWDHGKLSGGY